MTKHIIGVIEGFLIAILLLAAGYGVCILPNTTKTLATITDANSASPFSAEQLVTAACATQDYTIFTNDKAALAETLLAINNEAVTPYAGASADTIFQAEEEYTLPEDAMSHLDDVYLVVSRAHIVIMVSLTLALIFGVALCTFKRGGKTIFGRALFFAGLVLLAILFIAGMWALIDFNGLFAVFHSLFFAEGTWTFSGTSLLIAMYPLPFWMGMGLVWLCITALACILSLILGKNLGFSKKKTRKAR